MDEGVDQVLGRSADEKGADKAVALRRSQQKERVRLQTEISQSQKSIAELSDARAPIAAEVRKVEAEVGPIKYIAALIYGDTTDVNMLEAAVRWVIILLVIVFDPLAIMMLLASTESLRWERKARESLSKPAYPPDDGPLTDDQLDQIRATTSQPQPDPDPVLPEKSIFEQHPYLTKEFVHFKNLVPMPAPATVEPEAIADESEDEQELPHVKEAIKKWKSLNPNNTIKNQRHMLARGEIAELPWIALIESLPDYKAVHGFGTQLPKSGNKGDTYIRTDAVPNRLFKHNGRVWIELDKAISDSYTYDIAYIDYLIDKIALGEYDLDLLNESESEQVALRLQERNINEKH
jgi:hypothetical protein